MISERAAEIANEMGVQRGLFTSQNGQVFSEAHNQSASRDGSGFVLRLDRHLREANASNEEWYGQIKAVAAEAVRGAIIENCYAGKEFVGVIVGLARTGESYFNRFNVQMTLL